MKENRPNKCPYEGCNKVFVDNPYIWMILTLKDTLQTANSKRKNQKIDPFYSFCRLVKIKVKKSFCRQKKKTRR